MLGVRARPVRTARKFPLEPGRGNWLPVSSLLRVIRRYPGRR
jgi:hypothetical protein